MSLLNVTADTLSRDLGKKIPPAYVIIAKHSVLGMDSESIAELLGCDVKDVIEAEADEIYKEVRIFIGAAHMTAGVDQTLGLDGLEDMAIRRLSERIQFEKDPEFLLKVLAVTNKAQRRQSKPTSHVLDPSRGNGRTAITLSERLIQRLNRSGQPEELVRERELSISDGSMANPSFDEVDSFLHISRPTLPQRIEISTQTAEPSFDELEAEMKRKGY